MRKITAILMSLLMVSVFVPSVMASEQSIELCEKPVNTGGSWGMCSDMTGAQGIFTYNNVGSTLVVTEASATGLTNGEEYSLIYYKDTDAAHVLASTKAVNILATETSVDGSINFAPLNINTGNIPAGDDINPKGKIWIVPTTEINDDSTLKWTEYNTGLMNGYLFESDLYTETEKPSPQYTVRDRMGGIVYTASVLDSEASVTGSVMVLQYVPTTVGIAASDVNYGQLYQGRSGTGTSTITVTEIAGTDGYRPITVGLSVTAGVWTNTGITTIVNSVIPEVVTVDSATPVISTATLTVNVGSNVPASDTPYTQTITVNAVY